MAQNDLLPHGSDFWENIIFLGLQFFGVEIYWLIAPIQRNEKHTDTERPSHRVEELLSSFKSI